MKTRTLICPANDVLTLLKNEQTTLWRVEKKQPVLVPHEKYAGTWEWPYESHKARSGEKSIHGGSIHSKASWVAGLDPLDSMTRFCPYGQVGDRLLVKEALYNSAVGWRYRADDRLIVLDTKYKSAMLIWAHHRMSDQCPAARMPHWAGRLLLGITGIQFKVSDTVGLWGWDLSVKRVAQAQVE